MRKRSTDILSALLKYRKNISIDKLSKKYRVSPRALMKDIQDINLFLESIDQGVVHIDEKGLLSLDDSCDSQIIQDKIYKIDFYLYRMSQYERCICIIIILVRQTDYVTMEMIAEELYVSRITILHDVEIVKKRLGNYGAKITTKSNKGIKLESQEESTRLMLIGLFRDIIVNVRNEGIFQRIMIKKSNPKIPLAKFVELIQRYEKHNNISFGNHVFYENILFLFVTCNRIVTGFAIGMYDKPVNNYADTLLTFISKEENFSIDRNESSFFSHYIEQNGLQLEESIDKDAELSRILESFLSYIGAKSGVPFQNDQHLFKSLMEHISSVEDSDDLYVDFEEDVHPKYKELYTLVEANACMLERYLQRPLIETVRKSIVIHLCASLIRNRPYSEKASVLIACPGSIAMGKLLEAQIKNHFNFDIIDVVPIGSIKSDIEALDRKIDFIISTVPVKGLPLPIIVVNPILELKDLNAIQRHTFSLLNSNGSGLFSQHDLKLKLKKDIEDAFRGMVKEGNLQLLLDKIQDIIKTYRKVEKGSNVNIALMLEPDNICIEEDELTWEDALRKCGGILENNYYSGEYVEQVIKNVKQYGPYFILSPHVALAHAGPKHGVYKDGLSLLVSKRGIMFEGDLKVHLLFFFCTVGGIDYLGLFKEIIKISKDGSVHNVIQQNTCEGVLEEIVGNTFVSN